MRSTLVDGGRLNQQKPRKFGAELESAPDSGEKIKGCSAVPAVWRMGSDPSDRKENGRDGTIKFCETRLPLQHRPRRHPYADSRWEPVLGAGADQHISDFGIPIAAEFSLHLFHGRRYCPALSRTDPRDRFRWPRNRVSFERPFASGSSYP